MTLQHGVDTPEEAFVVASGSEHKLFVKHFKDRWLLNMFDQINRLVVVLEFNVRPVDTFFRVLFLFFSKHVLVELLLQFFVCVVDAQLLKSVFLENLKSKDVQ